MYLKICYHHSLRLQWGDTLSLLPSQKERRGRQLQISGTVRCKRQLHAQERLLRRHSCFLVLSTFRQPSQSHEINDPWKYNLLHCWLICSHRISRLSVVFQHLHNHTHWSNTASFLNHNHITILKLCSTTR